MKYQPVVFASKMRLNFVQGSILKYVSRYPRKNGKQDLEKASHFCQLGLEVQPVNFALPVDSEVHKYVEQNGFDEEMEQLISDIVNQHWVGISAHILNISEKVYGH